MSWFRNQAACRRCRLCGVIRLLFTFVDIYFWVVRIENRISRRSVNAFRCGRRLLFGMTVTLWRVAGQPPIPPPAQLVCPECALAVQTASPFGAPQVESLENPKPYTFDGIVGVTQWSVTARIVSMRPLVFDIIDDDPAMKQSNIDSCGVGVMPLVDAKLKDALSRLQFNQLVRAKLIFGGNPDFPHEVVVTELAPVETPGSAPGSCRNRSGIVISYRGNVEYVNVYGDGAIHYQDGHFNRFDNQKLSSAELGRLLRAFAANGFDSLPSAPPLVAGLERDSLTLICSRFQHVLLGGMEASLAPLLRMLDELKTRATSQAHYVMVYQSKTRLTILDWPFRTVRVNDLMAKEHYGTQIPTAIHDAVSREFLSRLPWSYTSMPAQDDPNRDVYVRDGGRLYRVGRPPCGQRPTCNTFNDLTAYPVEPPGPALNFSGAFGMIWPPESGVRLSELGTDGQPITNQEFEKQAPLFPKLFSGGATFIEDGYLYQNLRICRVDAQGPPPQCLHP